MHILHEPSLNIIVSQDGRPFVSLQQVVDTFGEPTVHSVVLDEDLISLKMELTADGLVADIRLKAKAAVDFPLVGIEVRSDGAPEVTAAEIEAAWLGGDFTTKPADRVLMLLRQRSSPTVRSGDASPSGEVHPEGVS